MAKESSLFSINGMFALPWRVEKAAVSVNADAEWTGPYFNVVSSFDNTTVATLLPLDVAVHLVESANAKVSK